MRLQRILIAVDFSNASVEAAKWTKQFFAPDADVVLLHVFDPPRRPLFAPATLPAPELIERAARSFAESRLERLADAFAGTAVRCELLTGKPADVIPNLAREIDADLIVIGPHGERPRTVRFLGSTADRIVRLSPVPVLVATSPRHAPPRKILVPVDDASITTKLLEYAHGLAKKFDAELTLFHVLSDAVYSHVASASYAETDDEEAARREIRAALEGEGQRWLDQLSRTGLDHSRVHAHVTHGNPGDATLEMANRSGTELIVLGRRGSGLVAPALLGSTVGTVLHGARCPVLVVAEDREASEKRF